MSISLESYKNNKITYNNSVSENDPANLSLSNIDNTHSSPMETSNRKGVRFHLK